MPTATRPAPRAVPLAFLAALAAAALMHATRDPAAPLDASAADTLFSSGRAMPHVRAMARSPHPVGTAAHDSVRDYVVGALRDLGLEPELQRTTAIGTRFAQVARVENILARLPGTEGGRAAVLLVAHYDGVGAAPAAGDDASGTAVVLETLRAIRAGPPLRHDVIALIADAEEAGLLGAAAFVREHPWAGDVELILNHEARGTGGFPVMFQTGPDNLAQVRALRRVPGISASSLSATVYQFLPNDTDLSELFALEKPGLNFAFADGVERYHTSQDDPEHLDVRSLQQEGDQTLRLTREFAGGPLPAPRLGNAVFFDLPLVGLVYYPETWASPLAILAVALSLWALIAVARRERRWWLGLPLGLLGLVLTAGVAIGLTWLAGRDAPAALTGQGPRGPYAIGVAAATLAIALGWWALARRWAAAATLGMVALLLWTILGVIASWRLPGLSFGAVWPAMAVAIATIVSPPAETSLVTALLRRLPAALALFLLVPLLYGMGLVALGVGVGGLAIAAVVSVTAWLLAEDLELVAGTRRWAPALVLLVAGAALVLWGRRAAARDADFPVRSVVAYAEAADDSTGWLVAPEAYADSGSWNLAALGQAAERIAPDSSNRDATPEQWLTRMLGRQFPVMAAQSPRLGLEPPSATLLADSLDGAGRRVEFLVRPGSGVSAVTMRVVGAEVVSSSVEGRPVDRSRYRYQSPEWGMTYWAPPDSGFRLGLVLPVGGAPRLELVAQRQGIDGVTLPPRPAHVVPSQTGDIRLAWRSVSLASP